MFSSVVRIYCLAYYIVLGVTVTVDNSVNYIVNENRGPVSIILLLDQPSYHPFTVIAHPRERSTPNAKGMYII